MQTSIKKITGKGIAICFLIMCNSACWKDTPEKPIVFGNVRLEALVPSMVYSNKKEALLDGSRTETLNGKRSLKFLWVCTNFPAGTRSPRIENPTRALTKVDSLNPGQYRFRFTVDDSLGHHAESSYAMEYILDTLLGKFPIASAGPDRQIKLPVNETDLDGYQTWFLNPNGRALNFIWTLISKPLGSIDPIINTPLEAQTRIWNLIEGKYQFRLEVVNELGFKSADTMEVTVLPDPLKGTTRIYEDLVWKGIIDYDWGHSVYMQIYDQEFTDLRNHDNMEVWVWDEKKSAWFNPDFFPWYSYGGSVLIYSSDADTTLIGKKTRVQMKFY
jgi:hypothetical protein